MIEHTHIMYEDKQGVVRTEPISGLGLGKTQNGYCVIRYLGIIRTVDISEETYYMILAKLNHRINRCVIEKEGK